MNKEHVIYFDKDRARKTLKVFPIMLYAFALSLGISLYLENLINNRILISFIVMIKSITIFFFVLLLFAVLYIFFKMKNNDPIVILNQNGIWMKHYGLISWEDIEEIAPYLFLKAPIETIGIQVKNTSLLLKQSSFNGKMGIFWSKIFKRPHIILEKNDEILNFAKRFIK